MEISRVLTIRDGGGMQGDVAQMLAAYHGGPDTRQHGAKTQAYVQGILGRLTGGGTGPAAAAAGRGKGFRADPAASAKARN